MENTCNTSATIFAHAVITLKDIPVSNVNRLILRDLI